MGYTEAIAENAVKRPVKGGGKEVLRKYLTIACLFFNFCK